jgi:hypothetical protein
MVRSSFNVIPLGKRPVYIQAFFKQFSTRFLSKTRMMGVGGGGGGGVVTTKNGFHLYYFAHLQNN